jgi:hypothetical protein
MTVREREYRVAPPDMSKLTFTFKNLTGTISENKFALKGRISLEAYDLRIAEVFYTPAEDDLTAEEMDLLCKVIDANRETRIEFDRYGD